MSGTEAILVRVDGAGAVSGTEATLARVDGAGAVSGTEATLTRMDGVRGLTDFELLTKRVCDVVGADRRAGGRGRIDHGAGETLKRIIDIVVASGALVVFAPLMMVIAVVIKATSPGPVLFKQLRLGRLGREFWCYKFRTMVADAEKRLQESEELRKQFDENFKLENDPRLTPPGAFLRKTSLDELPQLLNVLRGDLSLIGPRPIVPRERVKYAEHAEKLLSVKPGLGGLWQVYGRSDTTYEDRVRFDMLYVDNRSLLLDLKLLVSTAYTVIRGRGAY